MHSHASPNVGDGLNDWDGTDYHYFHAGGKGQHSGWGTYVHRCWINFSDCIKKFQFANICCSPARRLFDYGKWEVLRFLMSNLKWFIDEYKYFSLRILKLSVLVSGLIPASKV